MGEPLAQKMEGLELESKKKESSGTEQETKCGNCGKKENETREIKYGEETSMLFHSEYEVSVLPISFLDRFNPRPKIEKTELLLKLSGTKEFAWAPVGTVSLTLSTPSNGLRNDVTFFVSKYISEPIIGLRDSQKFDEMKNVDAFEHFVTLKNKYGKVFENKGPSQYKDHPGQFELLNSYDIATDLTSDDLDVFTKPFEKMGIVSRVTKPVDKVCSFLFIYESEYYWNIRLCLREEDLNAILEGGKPINPVPETILEDIKNHKLFSIFSLRHGCWRIELDKETSERCVFETENTLYKINRVFFGLKWCPVWFHKKTQEVFGDIPGVHVFYDEIIISGTSKEEHDESIKMLMERALENDVKLEADPMKYTKNEIKYKSKKHCSHKLGKNKKPGSFY